VEIVQKKIARINFSKTCVCLYFWGGGGEREREMVHLNGPVE